MSLLAELITLLGSENCLSDPADQLLYGYDHSCLEAKADVVTLPSNTEQVAEIIKIANKYITPVIARGQATNTCGSTVPIQGGIIISTQKLNTIIEINTADRYAVVQPGVINGQLQEQLNSYNLFWPPDPSSAKICTIGGNLACNAAGPSAVKYGVTRDHVLGLTFVSGNGEIIQTGVYTTKGVVGYDLTRLLIGSEGTLGIITEAILKLTPKAEVTHTIRADYNSIDAATEVITKLMQQNITPSALELLDENCLNLIKSDLQLNIPSNSKALLLIEVNGSALEISYHSDIIYNLAKNHNGCLNAIKATDSNQRKLLWQARKSLSPKLKFIAPQKINEDIVVPISQLPDLISYINQLATEYNISIVNFGHAGNGNIHVNLLINPHDLQQKTNAELCLNKIFSKVLELRGTISGEHGVGLTKAKFAKQELSVSAINLNKKIKQAFDQNNILNPQLCKDW
jgi:D-lactate dehydrogenase